MVVSCYKAPQRRKETRLLAPGEHPPTVQSQSEQMWVLRAVCSWPRAQSLSLAFFEHYRPLGHPAREIYGSSFLQVSQDPFELCSKRLTLPSSELDPNLSPVFTWLTRQDHPPSQKAAFTPCCVLGYHDPSRRGFPHWGAHCHCPGTPYL